MAYNKRTWLGRQGTGLNKFSIGGASPVTIVNQPDSVTQVGDALSAGNLNDLEDRIEDAFDDVDTALDTKADEQDVTNLNNALTAIDHRLDNLEQAKGDYVVANYKDGAITPSGKGAWAIVEGLRGVSRVDNNLFDNSSFADSSFWRAYNGSVSIADGVARITSSEAGSFGLIPPQDTTVYANHKYLMYAIARTGNANKPVRLSTAFSETEPTLASTTFAPIMMIGSRTSDYTGSYPRLFITTAEANDWFEVKEFHVVDLSLYFGGTIPSDADTIAEIQTNYPHLLTPSEYGVRIVDSSYSGVRAWGKNLISGFQVGKDWALLSNPERACFRLDNPSYIGKAMVLSATWPSTVNTIRVVRIRDANVRPNSFTYEEPISIEIVGNVTMTQAIVDECKAQLELGSTATSYSPYMENTLSLTFSGKSAGSVSEMYYPETGEVTHPLKRQAVGTGWLYRNDGSILAPYFYKDVSSWGIAFKDSTAGKNNILLAPYINVERLGLQGADMVICTDGSASQITQIEIKDSRFNNATDFSNYIKDFEITYEPITPDPSTFVTPILDNTLLTESGGRMATVQTGTVVDGSFDMGFITL